jgi:hypothetical protein
MVKRRYVKMTLIKPGTGRAQIQEQGSELRVTIPAKKLVHHFIFRCLARWLGNGRNICLGTITRQQKS